MSKLEDSTGAKSPRVPATASNFHLQFRSEDSLADQTLGRALDLGRQAIRAHGGTIFSLEDEQLRFLRVAGSRTSVEALLGLQFPAEDGIAGACASSGETLRVDDATRDPRFANRFDAHSGFRTGSMLTVPVKRDGEILGVLQLVRNQGESRFVSGDEDTTGLLTGFVADALVTLREMAQVRNADIKEVAGTVFFLDLAGYSEACEKHGDQKTMAALKRWFLTAMPVLQRFGADFVKCTGDGCLVLFQEQSHGVRHIEQAFECASEVRRIFQQAPFRVGCDEHDMRIGLAPGRVTFGNVSSADCLLLDVFGRTVNRAHQLLETGPVGKIALSPQTWELLCQDSKISPDGVQVMADLN